MRPAGNFGSGWSGTKDHGGSSAVSLSEPENVADLVQAVTRLALTPGLRECWGAWAPPCTGQHFSRSTARAYMDVLESFGDKDLRRRLAAGLRFLFTVLSPQCSPRLPACMAASKVTKRKELATLPGHEKNSSASMVDVEALACSIFLRRDRSLHSFPFGPLRIIFALFSFCGSNLCRRQGDRLKHLSRLRIHQEAAGRPTSPTT